MSRSVTVVDFETEGIDSRPSYPPVPVGFSILSGSMKNPKYYAWGHPEGNNCSKEDAVNVLRNVWMSSNSLLFHNAKFDIDVAEVHMGLKIPPWDRIHDTLFLLFLAEPHAISLSLKKAAENILSMPPEEQDNVRNYLIESKIVKKTSTGWGASICKAPGSLVAIYANGDVIRTKALFDILYPKIKNSGMSNAYDRERKLMSILLENERKGVLIDKNTLRKDITKYRQSLENADQWLRKRLSVPLLNLDSNDEVASALEANGIVTEWVATATGKRSTSKKNMSLMQFKDYEVAQVYGYRQRLQTCLSTFMESWYITAEESGGRIFTSWNQVRQAGNGGFSVGARTGRLSSTPNFQNIPKMFEGRGDGYTHPSFLKELHTLPNMRKYFIPDDKYSYFCRRDFAQQELRILAHLEDGELCRQYIMNPSLDLHELVGDKIKEITGISLGRSAVKILNFGEIYGMGTVNLARSMGVSVDMAYSVKRAKRASLPGLESLETSIKERCNNNEPVYTWGGRAYYVEEPKIIDGRIRTFEYKMLNYLIQGSAADITKEAVIRYNEVKKDGRLLLTVHDEIDISCNKESMKEEMLRLRDVMMSIETDVPMLSDGEYGVNWGSLKCLKEEKPSFSRWNHLLKD